VKNNAVAREASVPKDANGNAISAQTFTFRELATATRNFRQECFLGEGGFGRVYKGHLESTGQVTVFFFFLKYILFFSYHLLCGGWRWQLPSLVLFRICELKIVRIVGYQHQVSLCCNSRCSKWPGLLALIHATTPYLHVH
jgi:hypothetical protein